MGGVIAVIDRDEAHPQGGKQLCDIPAAVDVVTAKSRKVFDDHAVDLACLDGGHHLLKMGAVKICSGVAVVIALHHQFEFRVAGHIIVDEVALVFDAVTLHFAAVLPRQPAISVAIKKFHEKTS